MIDNKKLNIFIFSIRVIPYFCQKFEISSPCLFSANWSKKVFGDILDRNIAFLDYKNIDIRKLQNVYFSKCFNQKFEF